MTNADKIRFVMTDEELAEFLSTSGSLDGCIYPWLDWLKEEAEDDSRR